jgi:penicillin-binding protein 1A
VLLIALIILGLIALGMGMAVGRISGTIRRYTDVTIPPIPVGPQTTFVFDRHGKPITTLHAAVNRVIVPMDKIAPSLREAVVAIEDQDFYEHRGLDPAAIVRAAWENTITGRIEQGGSTITQQFVKNVFTTGERTLERKIHEAVLAVKLERQFSKDQILEKYLNTVYFGRGAYGAQAAAVTYFGVPAAKLSLAQSALLAGLIAAPGRWDPKRNAEDAQARRNLVLDRMAEQGYITPERAARVRDNRVKAPGLKRLPTPYPYFVQHVVDLLVDSGGYDRTFEGGLRVTTTLDPGMQQAAEQAVATHLPDPKGPSGALVAIDPSTGGIRALVGGRDFEKTKFNLATQGHRQTGSAAKTFTLVAAVEQGISLNTLWQGPSSLVIEDPRCYDPTKDEPWEVHNYADEGTGTLPLGRAIAESVNTIFAQLVLDVGPEQVMETARKMGVRSSSLEPVCSITLGSQAMTPLEMTSAYATLAARGVYHKPVAIQEIRSATDEVLSRAPDKGRRVIEQNDADVVTSALEGVIQSGTGTAASIGWPAAGKTGTGQDYEDAWFCGYTPQLAACVWVGYRKGEIPMENIYGYSGIYGGSIPAMIWHDFMASAMSGLPYEDFATPDLSGYDTVPEHAIVYVPKPEPSPEPSKRECHRPRCRWRR